MWETLPFNKKKTDTNDKLVEDINKDLYSMKLKEEFISNITHDLKTPLTIIIGYSQLLKEEKYNSNESFTNAIEYIESESRKLNLMIDNLIEKTRNSKN